MFVWQIQSTCWKFTTPTPPWWKLAPTVIRFWSSPRLIWFDRITRKINPKENCQRPVAQSCKLVFCQKFRSKRFQANNQTRFLRGNLFDWDDKYISLLYESTTLQKTSEQKRVLLFKKGRTKQKCLTWDLIWCGSMCNIHTL